MNYKKDDIVFWSYSEAKLLSLKGYSPYHCRSQIAVFNGERFVDTFWHGGENFSFGPEKIGSDIVVEYVGNFADLDKQNHYCQFEDLDKYYNRVDIVDLNHSNSSRGNLYLRKGAKRSLAKIKESLEYKIKRAQENIDHQNWVLDQDKEKLLNLDEKTIDSIYF